MFGMASAWKFTFSIAKCTSMVWLKFPNSLVTGNENWGTTIGALAPIVAAGSELSMVPASPLTRIVRAVQFGYRAKSIRQVVQLWLRCRGTSPCLGSLKTNIHFQQLSKLTKGNAMSEFIETTICLRCLREPCECEKRQRWQRKAAERSELALRRKVASVPTLRTHKPCEGQRELF